MKPLLAATLLAFTATAFGQNGGVQSGTAATMPGRPAPAPATIRQPVQGDLTIGQVNSLTNHLDDWAQLKRYAADNAKLVPATKPRVVFYGDSLTDAWHNIGNSFGPGQYVNRGISGQTTPQMVVRFRQDVIDLHPALVVILAGTNDVAGNTGPMTIDQTIENFTSMVELAQANHIKVVISSVLPASSFSWNPGQKPATTVREINERLKKLAAERHVDYLDYYPALANEEGGMKDGLSRDGVHPTAAGYAIMEPLADKAVAQALGKR